jgi:cytochrome c-type biogenesis protein CcmH/NrfG
MSRNEDPTAVRFCPACGTAAVSGARFCTACGAALRGDASAPAAAARPIAPQPALREQVPGLVVMTGFLAIGLGLWFGILAGDEAPARLPIAERPPAEAAPPGSGELPADHPPLALPQDVRKFIADLEAEAAAAPTELATWRRLADVQYRASQIDAAYLPKAESSFRKVLELAPDDVDAMRGLGNVHFDRDEYTQAIEWYAKVLESRPGDASVRTDLATMHLYAGDSAKAIELYEKVIADQPGFFQAHFNLGIAHRRSGDETAALASFEKARALAPDDRTREQIAAVLAEAPSTGGSGPTTDGGAAGGFQQIVETTLRRHPIAGPKIVGFEWGSATRGKVLLDGFPMEGMPEPIRVRFLEPLEKDLVEARTRSGADEPVELALVDRATGRVMATVAPK